MREPCPDMGSDPEVPALDSAGPPFVLVVSSFRPGYVDGVQNQRASGIVHRSCRQFHAAPAGMAVTVPADRAGVTRPSDAIATRAWPRSTRAAIPGWSRRPNDRPADRRPGPGLIRRSIRRPVTSTG